MALNLAAVLVPTACLQLFVMPYVAQSMESVTYGYLMTVFAVLNLIPGTLGRGRFGLRPIFGFGYYSTGIIRPKASFGIWVHPGDGICEPQD